MVDEVKLIKKLTKSRINNTHTKSLIEFLKKYTYIFNQLAPTRLQGDRKKYFEKYNLVTNKSFSEISKYLKDKIFLTGRYKYLIDGNITTDDINEAYSIFTNKNGNYALFKNVNGYKQFESFLIRLSNAFNHNNFVFIRDRLFLWNEHGKNVQGIFVMQFNDFDMIIKQLESIPHNK